MWLNLSWSMFYPISEDKAYFVVTDSLQELKGSSSHSKRMSGNGKDAMPKFSLSDVSDDELQSQG